MGGYFRGLLPRILRKGMGSIIAWSFYEYLIDKKDAVIFKWNSRLWQRLNSQSAFKIIYIYQYLKKEMNIIRQTNDLQVQKKT